MPVPPFGFSVGDFVACASLIGDIVRALNDAKGSKSEYRALSETLQSLNQALTISHIVYLQWDTAVIHPQYRNNATALLKGMGDVRQKCVDLMQIFLNKVQNYDDAFIEERGGRAARDWRKVTWLFKKDDVKTLREELNLHLRTLQEFTNAFLHNHLGAHTQVMYSTMGSILASVSELKENVNTLSRGIPGGGQSIPAGLGHAWGTSPTITENVLLLDATGRSLLLPMLFMSSPMLLHDLLNIMYRGLPGHQKIMRREYTIADEDRDGELIDPANWSSVIHPGMQISLNVVFRALSSWSTQHCPRCNQPSIGPILPGKRKRCHKCQLTFSLFEKERIVDESQISGSASTIEAEPSSVNSTPVHQKHSTPSQKGHYATGEDFYFCRVHYHREVLKARPVEVPDQGEEQNFPILEVDELPPLHKAAVKGDLAGISALLDAGDDIDSPLPYQRVRNFDGGIWYFKKCSPLHLAAWFGRSRAIRLLVDNGANLSSHDAGLSEVLQHAICGGNHGCIPDLLELGSNINARDELDLTPLHEACHYASPLLASLLLAKGADVTAEDSRGLTPLHWAARAGNTEVIKALFEYGANIDAEARDGSSPLHFAAWNGHPDAVHALIEGGADVDLKDKNGCTPLHNAAWKGHNAVVEELLNNGSQVQNHCLFGETPLSLASGEGHLDVVKILIENGVVATLQNPLGRLPANIASRYGHLEVVQFLINSVEDANLKDRSGRTVLQSACFGGHLPIVQFLLEKGAEIHVQDDEGRTPLHDAAYGGHDEILQVLLERGADVSPKTEDGGTALWWASNKGHLSTIKILLRYGADINSQNNEKKSVLHGGILNGSEEVVRALLDAGCDPYLQDINGRTALHLSLEKKNDGMAKLVLEYTRRDEKVFSEFTAGADFENLADRILGMELDNSEDISSRSQN